MDTLYLHLVLLTFLTVRSDVLFYFALKFVSRDNLYYVIHEQRAMYYQRRSCCPTCFHGTLNKGLENWFILLQCIYYHACMVTLNDDTPDRI